MPGTKRILIVEDDADIGMVEQAYLEAAGLGITLAADGARALELMGKEQFDLILLDLMLPGKDGCEVCRDLRDRVDIPILMVTARTETLDRIRGLALGADDYIAKPFDPAELAARVNANLRQYDRLRQRWAGDPPGGQKRYGPAACASLLTAGKSTKETGRSSLQTGSLNC